MRCSLLSLPSSYLFRSQDTAQAHSKSAAVKAIFASAERDGGAGSKARKERRDSLGSVGSLADRGSLGRNGSIGDQAIAYAINSSRSSFSGGSGGSGGSSDQIGGGERRTSLRPRAPSISLDSQLGQVPEGQIKQAHDDTNDEGATISSRVRGLACPLSRGVTMLSPLVPTPYPGETTRNGAGGCPLAHCKLGGKVYEPGDQGQRNGLDRSCTRPLPSSKGRR